MLIVICIIIAAIMLIFSGAIYLVRKEAGKSDPDYFLQYMEMEDAHFSFLLRRNGERICSINENEKMPAAGVAKLLIAYEFAKQAANGKINPDQLVPLEDLELFYVNGTDGSGHLKWLVYLEKQRLIQDGKVTLLEAGRGMLHFSSNANTDYLLQLLTPEQVNASAVNSGFGFHDPLYHFGAAVLMPAYLEDVRSVSMEEAIETIEKMSMDDYRKLAGDIASLLGEARLNHLKLKGLPVPERFRRLWSDRLPGGTAKGYVSILGVLNRRAFPQAEQDILNSLLEGIGELPASRARLDHFGRQGGSASVTFGLAAYAADQNGNETEAVFLANDLQPVQQMQLNDNLNAFMTCILTSDSFREKLGMLHGNIK